MVRSTYKAEQSRQQQLDEDGRHVAAPSSVWAFKSSAALNTAGHGQRPSTSSQTSGGGGSVGDR